MIMLTNKIPIIQKHIYSILKRITLKKISKLENMEQSKKCTLS